LREPAIKPAFCKSPKEHWSNHHWLGAARQYEISKWLERPQEKHQQTTDRKYATVLPHEERTKETRMRNSYSLLSLLLLLLASHPAAHAAPRWQPVADDVYLQEIGHQVPTEHAVEALAVHQGTLYAGFQDGIRHLSPENTLQDTPGAPSGPIWELTTVQDTLYAITEDALYVKNGPNWPRIAQGRFYGVLEHLGQVLTITETQIFQIQNGILDPIASNAPLKMRRAASYAETLYLLGLDRLMTFDGKEFDFENVIDFGAFPSKDLRDVLAHGAQLIVATHAGLGRLRGTAATQILGVDGLPYNECLELAPGFADDYWIATTHGAIRATGDEYQPFSGQRWLPHNQVNTITCAPNVAYLGTNKGIAIIQYEPYTLLKKAHYYEQHLETYGQKRLGFTHILMRSPDNTHWIREVSDNDVGWSTHYWASQAFKWAATGDPAARQEAIQGFNTMKWSEQITGLPGYPARSIWAVGERGHKAMHGSGGYDAEWHATDDGQWEWKGDTSSDEIDAHFYYAAIFHELIDDPALKQEAAQHLARIAGHILENGYHLIDVDGQPTVWGKWSPEYFRTITGYAARGLNGLEVLNYMRTAHALTGQQRFQDAIDQLIAIDYHRPTIRQKHTFPEPLVFHSDDRLAFYTYYTLLQYEKDPYLRSFYRRSLERSWEIERIERIPWFNFIYAKLTGNPAEEQQATQALREWPLDLTNYAWDQSPRQDLHPLPGYQPYAGGTRYFSPRERGPHRWTNFALQTRGGAGGTVVEDPAGWLDAYWMARHLGIILPPTTQDPAHTTPPPPDGTPKGAAPYTGPPAPNLLPPATPPQT